MIYGAWRFIHSKKFSEHASKKVSEILTKKAGAHLTFEGMDFNFFPPATVFKKVHIIKIDPKVANVDLELNEVSVAFAFSSFFSSDLEIEDLYLNNGRIKLSVPDKESPDIQWENLSTQDIFRQYAEIYKSSPVHLNLAKLENIKLYVDQSLIEIKSLTLNPHPKEVRLESQLGMVQIFDKKKSKFLVELDSLEANLHLSKARWRVNKLKVKRGDDLFEVKASFFNKSKKLEMLGSIHFDTNSETILKEIPNVSKELSSISSHLEGQANLNGLITDPEADISVQLKQFKSPWLEFQAGSIEVRKRKNFLFVNRFDAQNGIEKYFLNRPFVFFDIHKNILTKNRISLSLKDAFTNNFLSAIKSSLGVVKGYFTGIVEVNWSGDKVIFELKEKAFLKDFKLVSEHSKKPILQNAGMQLDNTIVTLEKNLDVLIDAKIVMPNTKIQALGSITSKGIHIVAKDSKLDMKAFGPISGVAITGAGPTSMEIIGPFDDVRFNFNVDWNNFSVVDLNFGRVKSDFSFALKDVSIDIKQLSGVFNQTNFSASGQLFFDDRSGMNLKLDFPTTNFTDAQKMYQLIFKNLKLPVVPEFTFATSYRISGGFDLDQLKVEGKLRGYDLKVVGEEAERIGFNFSLNNNVLSFKEIRINKSRGEINASATINLANNYSELEGSISGLRLRDFVLYKKLNLSYDGDLNVDFDGNGTKGNFSSRFKVKVQNPFIENIPASSSNALIYLNADDVVINANLLSGKVKLDSTINLKNDQVNLKAVFDSNDLRELLGVIAAHNISEKSISGKVKASLSSQLKLSPFEVRKFSLEINQFNLKKNEIDLKVDPAHNSVAIEQGEVKSWDLRFRDGVDFFNSKAYNGPRGSIVYDQNFSIKTSSLEFFTNIVEKANGTFKGQGQLVVDKKLEITKFDVTGQKNSIKFKGVPGSLTGLDFSLTKKSSNFELTNLVGKYGEGDVSAKGVFFFDDIFPQINLDYKIERSTIPLFKRSTILASSSGTITGTELPYKLNGKLTLLHGEFLDDPNDFTKDQKINLDNIKKYLPEKGVIDNKGILNLNVSFDTVNPITIKNNLSEVYVKGAGQLTGDVFNPDINSRIEVVPTTSKFKFKGHDFSLNQGYVEIRDRGKNRTSDMKFVGLSKINDYDVKVDISGSIEKMNIALSSEPALAQEDLLSLLTLGVTSDISKNLEASERKSVTTVGIGTLLFDQLKINDDLNSMLGLKLSVMPEFKEDESSLIQGKSAVAEGSSSKLKSATKIKINKQITKQVDVSVSSTVGGSIEQTQEMNINYNINKKFSIEGVYEVKPSEDENTNTPNSIGADIKYRWSF